MRQNSQPGADSCNWGHPTYIMHNYHTQVYPYQGMRNFAGHITPLWILFLWVIQNHTRTAHLDLMVKGQKAVWFPIPLIPHTHKL